jgi:hypothetical protein
LNGNLERGMQRRIKPKDYEELKEYIHAHNMKASIGI